MGNSYLRRDKRERNEREALAALAREAGAAEAARMPDGTIAMSGRTGALLDPIEYDDGAGDRCTSPSGHAWAFTGTAYGGDDESYRGEGRCYCTHCGADGDA